MDLSPYITSSTNLRLTDELTVRDVLSLADEFPHWKNVVGDREAFIHTQVRKHIDTWLRRMLRRVENGIGGSLRALLNVAGPGLNVFLRTNNITDPYDLMDTDPDLAVETAKYIVDHTSGDDVMKKEITPVLSLIRNRLISPAYRSLLRLIQDTGMPLWLIGDTTVTIPIEAMNALLDYEVTQYTRVINSIITDGTKGDDKAFFTMLLSIDVANILADHIPITVEDINRLKEGYSRYIDVATGGLSVRRYTAYHDIEASIDDLLETVRVNIQGLSYILPVSKILHINPPFIPSEPPYPLF